MHGETFAAIDEQVDEYREELFDLLRQPSVSASGEGIEECAGMVEGLLERHGVDARRIETGTYPLVYGEAGPADAPTVLFYGHYDVQPAGDPDLWDSPAFEPTVREGSIYARGAGDNKGQFVAHAFAVDAVRRARGDLPVQVKFLIEGEEESGSRGLIDYLDGDPPEIDPDLVYVSDGPMHRSGRPTLIYGNRGILGIELSLARANRDLHSGNFGGPVPNPANELVDLLDSMMDGTGVGIDGFYDDAAVSEADREAARSVPVGAAALKADLGVDAFTVPDEDYYVRNLTEPTMTINGLQSGYGGEGVKTIIPSDALAKVDFRLVPDQDPDEIFELVEAHVAARNPDVEVEQLTSFPPMKTPIDTPAAGPLRSALESAWGAEPVELPMLGGSVPAAYFRRAVDAPILLVPYANADQNNHAPNEHLDVACFENGIRTSAAAIERLPSI